MADQPKILKPFGLWPGPVSPASLAVGISFSDISWDAGGALVWRESRSDHSLLVALPPDGQSWRELTGELNVRAGVGYGGGDFTVSAGSVAFVEAGSGRLFRQELAGGQARPLTPAFGSAAAPKFSPDSRWVLYVHTYEDQDSLALVDSQGSGWPVRLAQGADFYMQPAWHPGGNEIAYIAWDHPHMPWDSSRLYLGKLDFTGPRLVESSILAGGEGISVLQPEFSPDGRHLAYISDETGWWQIYLRNLQTGAARQLTHEPAEHGLSAWSQGLRSYVFSPDGRFIFYVRSQNARQTLWSLDLTSGAHKQIILPGYAAFSQLAISPDGARFAVIASGPSIPTRLLVCRPDGSHTVIRRSQPENLPEGAYSQPEPFSWTGEDGDQVFGLFYAPHSQEFTGTGLPPLVVSVHGGPTGQRDLSFSPQAQFFAGRGYGYLELNYRGSTGYGRAYRDRLPGNWGVYDVQDAVSGARHLVERGLVDGRRMAILGGSAGGFTVLQTLVDHPGFFKAGICLYGVANQFTFAAETHKFEAHYSDSLLGVLPEAAEIYRQRSPQFSIDRIQDPLAVFHGANDRVVPPAQSEMLVQGLQRRGVPCIYHLYPGEGHGFRKAETIEHFYTAVEQFLHQYLIYA